MSRTQILRSQTNVIRYWYIDVWKLSEWGEWGPLLAYNLSKRWPNYISISNKQRTSTFYKMVQRRSPVSQNYLNPISQKMGNLSFSRKIKRSNKENHDKITLSKYFE